MCGHSGKGSARLFVFGRGGERAGAEGTARTHTQPDGKKGWRGAARGAVAVAVAVAPRPRARGALALVFFFGRWVGPSLFDEIPMGQAPGEEVMEKGRGKRRVEAPYLPGECTPPPPPPHGPRRGFRREGGGGRR